jgi:hypothetical protein
MNGVKTRSLQWSLKTFIGCVLVTGCLLAFVVSRFTPQYEIDVSALGPLTSGDDAEISSLATSEIIRQVERVAENKKLLAGFRVSKLDSPRDGRIVPSRQDRIKPDPRLLVRGARCSERRWGHSCDRDIHAK